MLRTPLVARLGIPPVVFYWLLAILLAVLVLYPFTVLLTSSFFTGQPGRLGNFTLANYAVWLGSWDLLADHAQQHDLFRLAAC